MLQTQEVSKSLLKNNIDISWRREDTFKKEDFHIFDKIFVIDRNNYNDVIGLSS